MSSFWVWRLRVANGLIHPSTEAQNSVAKFLQCCLRCCFWCLEKMVKFLNRNAYIMVSRPLLVYGALSLPSWPHVCPTAWRAFWYLVIGFVPGISGCVIPCMNQGYTFSWDVTTFDISFKGKYLCWNFQSVLETQRDGSEGKGAGCQSWRAKIILGSTGWKERIKSCNDLYRQTVEWAYTHTHSHKYTHSCTHVRAHTNKCN